MDVRVLKTFMQVVEQGNFTKAAKALGYSQSAVTVQMQSLESELGVKLFDRIVKNVYLTGDGKRFVEYAGDAIAAIERAEHFAKSDENLSGTVRFGLVDSILNAVFIDIFPEINRRFPGLDLDISICSARELETKIRANELDLGYFLDYKMPKKEWVRLREEVEPIIFVCNPSNPLAGKEATFEEVIAQRMILMPHGEGYRYLFDDELAKRNLFKTPSVEIASVATTIRLTEASDYVTMLPVFAARKHMQRGTLAEVRVPGCEMHQWSQLAYLKGKVITPVLSCFIDTVKELLPPIGN